MQVVQHRCRSTADKCALMRKVRIAASRRGRLRPRPFWRWSRQADRRRSRTRTEPPAGARRSSARASIARRPCRWSKLGAVFGREGRKMRIGGEVPCASGFQRQPFENAQCSSSGFNASTASCANQPSTTAHASSMDNGRRKTSRLVASRRDPSTMTHGMATVSSPPMACSRHSLASGCRGLSRLIAYSRMLRSRTYTRSLLAEGALAGHFVVFEHGGEGQGLLEAQRRVGRSHGSYLNAIGGALRSAARRAPDG